MQLTTPARNAAVKGVGDLMDVGTTNPEARIKVYTASKATLLAVIKCNDPAFLAPVGGSQSLDVSSVVEDNQADESGIAAEAEFINKDEVIVMEGSCGVQGSGKDLQFNSVNLQQNVPVQVTSCTITQPAGSPA